MYIYGMPAKCFWHFRMFPMRNQIQRVARGGAGRSVRKYSVTARTLRAIIVPT